MFVERLLSWCMLAMPLRRFNAIEGRRPSSDVSIGHPENSLWSVEQFNVADYASSRARAGSLTRR
jgi:hypothetical protein